MDEKNNKLSYFLLLIAVGLSIFFLLYKDQSINNDQIMNKEPFTGAFTEAFTEDNIYVPNNNTYKQTKIEIPKQPEIQQPTMQPVKEQFTSIDEEASPSPSPSLPDVMFSPTNIDSSLFNFTPNDESVNDFEGVNLNEAFNLPLPQGTNVDAVDFKKGNMDNYNAKDFLPKEINDEWFETDFSLAKYQLNDDKLINTERYIIGINTVGQSLKNASYDIRGTIPNPKFAVSPWMNSTYEPDFNLKPLC
jgi:hypothetical protein